MIKPLSRVAFLLTNFGVAIRKPGEANKAQKSQPRINAALALFLKQ
jgi:hypothetical protein